MLTIIIRCLIIYTIVLVLFRVMGKRQLGQMQPFELVLTLVIADLATIPMAEVSVPVLHGIIPVFTLVLIHFVLTYLSKISPKCSQIISGKPIIVINEKGIDYKALKALNITIDDLFEAIREQGCFSLDQIQYAIMETNGKISILQKAENLPVTNKDLNINVQESVIPVNLISEGKMLKENLKIANIDENFLHEFLKNKLGNCKIKKVLFMTIDKNGKIIVQKFGEPTMVFENQGAKK